MEPWRARLAEGDAEAAWTLFIDRYRRLILATIGRIVERDEVQDAFEHICQELSAYELARLCRYQTHSPRRASFSTWLVTVVHNLVVDWLRQTRGRRRASPPASLTDLQQQIFTCVFVEQRTHGETYEVVRAAMQSELSFGSFLKELAETYRVVEQVRPRGVMHYLRGPPPVGPASATGDLQVDRAESRARLAAALESLGVEERLAVNLYVVEGMSAAEVAHTVGWPNAKTVYNRVYRALIALRKVLERSGIGPADSR